MNAKTDDQILRELQTEADEWIERTFPERMGGVGADEAEVRKQLKVEADRWVRYNLDQRKQGREGTPSPDFHLYEEKPPMAPTVGPTGTDISGIKDDEC